MVELGTGLARNLPYGLRVVEVTILPPGREPPRIHDLGSRCPP